MSDTNGAQKSSIFKNSILNTWGVFFYFFCQWITTVAVVHLADFEAAGIFSLAISFSNFFGFFSRFGVRKYQINDVTHKHADGTYITARFLTSAVSAALFAAAILFTGFDRETLFCCVVLLFFKLSESFTDVIYGVFQKAKRYSVIALSYTLKGLLPLFAFCLTLYLDYSLVFACLGMTLAYLAVVLLYDLPTMLRMKEYDRAVDKKDIRKILWVCAPLMVYTLVNPYMTFITRYFVGEMFSETVLGYYSSISMVVVVMTTLAGSVFNVVSPEVSKQYVAKDYGPIKERILKMCAGFAAVGLLALCVGVFLGEFVLGLLFGNEILPYKYLLNPMILISIALMAVAYFSTIMVAIEQRKQMLIGNLAGALVCTITVYPLTKNFGLMGACICLGGSMLIQLLLLVLSTSRALAKKPKANHTS